MSGILKNPSYSKYTFRETSGYVVAPWISSVTHKLVTIRHSANISPWIDRELHLHRDSEEYYFLFHGELELLLGDSLLTLKPHEVLMVKPRIAHAVVGGKGLIQHFIIRTPASDDKQTAGELPSEHASIPIGTQRELKSDWGYGIPLTEEKYQNCWLFGFGEARFLSEYLCLAYLSFPSTEYVNADRHPHHLHLHRESWEYYTVLRGTRILQVEDELVEISVGEILEIPPGVKHVLQATHTPFEGFTFRVPGLNDKVEV